MDHSLVKAHIRLDAIAKNVRNLKNLVPASTKFMAVVKADGYGHGSVRVAQKALAAGADWLGVARIEETPVLRKNGIKAPILVFGYVYPSRVSLAAKLNLTLTVTSFEMAKALSDSAVSSGVRIPVHLKVDTGMGRLGLVISKDIKENTIQKNILDTIKTIHGLPGLDLEGIYTHFAAADEKDRSYTDHQIDLFSTLLAGIEKEKIPLKIRHAANSAGIMAYPAAHFDMVRAGISLYGLYPSSDMDRSRVTLTPAMELTSVVTAVRQVPKGFCVSYGMTHRTEKKTSLASVPIGYADGFSRRFSNNGTMLVKGKRAPIVGRVCMDQTMIDVGHIKGVKTGDEVVIFGKQKDSRISSDELAANAETINYEIVSALTARVKRVYSDSGAGSG